MVRTWQARRNEAAAIPPPMNEFHFESMFVHPKSYPRYPTSTISYILLHCNMFAIISTQIRHIKQKIKLFQSYGTVSSVLKNTVGWYSSWHLGAGIRRTVEKSLPTAGRRGWETVQPRFHQPQEMEGQLQLHSCLRVTAQVLDFFCLFVCFPGFNSI